MRHDHVIAEIVRLKQEELLRRSEAARIANSRDGRRRSPASRRSLMPRARRTRAFLTTLFAALARQR